MHEQGMPLWRSKVATIFTSAGWTSPTKEASFMWVGQRDSSDVASGRPAAGVDRRTRLGLDGIGNRIRRASLGVSDFITVQADGDAVSLLGSLHPNDRALAGDRLPGPWRDVFKNEREP